MFETQCAKANGKILFISMFCFCLHFCFNNKTKGRIRKHSLTCKMALTMMAPSWQSIIIFFFLNSFNISNIKPLNYSGSPTSKSFWKIYHFGSWEQSCFYVRKWVWLTGSKTLSPHLFQLAGRSPGCGKQDNSISMSWIIPLWAFAWPRQTIKDRPRLSTSTIYMESGQSHVLPISYAST